MRSHTPTPRLEHHPPGATITLDGKRLTIGERANGYTWLFDPRDLTRWVSICAGSYPVAEAFDWSKA